MDEAAQIHEIAVPGCSQDDVLLDAARNQLADARYTIDAGHGTGHSTGCKATPANLAPPVLWPLRAVQHHLGGEMARLRDRVALVTGASRGIGLATARRFAQEGAMVAMADINQQSLEVAAAAVREDGLAAEAIALDVTDRSQVEAAIEEIARRHGRLDILVNNAGIIRDNLLFRMSDDDWRQVIDVHLTGTFLCCRAAQRVMVQQGYGRIVNLSSASALGRRGQSNYASAKAGLQGLTKTLAIELGRFGITCNAVAPGFIETDMTRATAERMGVSFEQLVEEARQSIPVGRTGKPEDVAAAILFFATEEAGFINGQVLYVAGGPRA